MKLLHRSDLPADSMFSQGRPTTSGRIEPHKVAFEDEDKTIWNAPNGCFVGLYAEGHAAVFAESPEAVIELFESMAQAESCSNV